MEKRNAAIALTERADAYKAFGRIFPTPMGLQINFAGNGFEFELECCGAVAAVYQCQVPTYFQVYVDHEPTLRFCTEAGYGRLVYLAEELPEGKHVIRIIRDTDATKKGEVMAFSQIFFWGDPDRMKGTAPKAQFLEFVGDSITAGKYTEMQYLEGDAIHKATNSYAYRTAEALGVDFSVVARGGCGYFRVSTCPKTMHMLYPYYNGFEENPTPYVPRRRPDAVILALGTNDGEINVKESYENGTVPFATFEEALTEQIRLIRAMHGADVKIVLLHNMMRSRWWDEFCRVAEQEKTFLLQVTQDNGGGRNHPSAEGHRVIAEELTAFLRESVL